MGREDVDVPFSKDYALILSAVIIYKVALNSLEYGKLYYTLMSKIGERLRAVRERIASAEQQFGRATGSVSLLAVSKRKSADDIRAALAAGQREFGENYIQEAVEKIELLKDTDASWHFIGPIQRNKTRLISEHFAWVHSVDRLVLAERLSEQRPEALPPLNICLQVNIDREASKSGVDVDELPQLARQITALQNVRFRGLMAIPLATDDFESQRQSTAALRKAQEQLVASGHDLDTLSIGMTNDMEAAIAEGSTLVRIGTAIFGARD